MKSFLKEFLRDTPSEGGAAPRICLGAFGKHPAWDDHMDDIGLETESLVAAKRLLYQQGIGSQLDSGAWEKLDAEARLPAIHHEFVWVREKQLLAGRMWPSADGKRRALYPMVACVQGFDMGAATAIEHILPQLQATESLCRATGSPAKVREIIKDARERCAEAASAGAGTDEGPLDFAFGENFIRGPLARVLREARTLMASYWRGRFRERAEAPAVSIRVPAPADNAAHNLLFWHRFFAAIIAVESPLLLIKPLGHPWLDVIAGEPTAQEFFSLRAAPPAIPILGESAGETDEHEQQEALSLWDVIKDPDGGKEWAGLSQGRPWFKKIFG